jgi:cytidylate kinase
MSEKWDEGEHEGCGKYTEMAMHNAKLVAELADWKQAANVEARLRREFHDRNANVEARLRREFHDRNARLAEALESIIHDIEQYDIRDTTYQFWDLIERAKALLVR